MCANTASFTHIAISFGVISPYRVKLLERQRAEEPQMHLRLREAR